MVSLKCAYLLLTYFHHNLNPEVTDDHGDWSTNMILTLKKNFLVSEKQHEI